MHGIRWGGKKPSRKPPPRGHCCPTAPAPLPLLRHCCCAVAEADTHYMASCCPPAQDFDQAKDIQAMLQAVSTHCCFPIAAAAPLLKPCRPLHCRLLPPCTGL